MPEKLDLKDFRASRWVLLSNDFALPREGPSPPARDLIDRETWESIIQLTDHVTVKTTNDFGRPIRLAKAIGDHWVSITLDIFGPGDKGTSPFNQTVTNSLSELQASLFNAISGYYRTAIFVMRNALEHLTIGLDFELTPNRKKFDDWMNGSDDKDIKFGSSADALASKDNVRVGQLETRLMAAAGDTVFRQKNHTKSYSGGFSRRHFGELSGYTHGAPGKTEVDLWKSNGPIYCPDVFKEWCELYGKTIALAYLMLRLSLPTSEAHGPQLKSLYEEARRLIPSGTDGAKLLAAVSSDPVWT